MTTIEKIKQSPDLQMALSEMLFKALFPEKCWHEYTDPYVDIHTGGEWEVCNNCGEESETIIYNTNLFADWTGFGVVWEAVKDRKDGNNFFSSGYQYFLLGTSIYRKHIATPYFQLEVLKWLVGADKVEKVVNPPPFQNCTFSNTGQGIVIKERKETL